MSQRKEVNLGARDRYQQGPVQPRDGAHKEAAITSFFQKFLSFALLPLYLIIIFLINFINEAKRQQKKEFCRCMFPILPPCLQKESSFVLGFAFCYF